MPPFIATILERLAVYAVYGLMVGALVFFKCYSHYHTIIDSMAQAGRDQTIQSKLKDAENDKITANIRNELADSLRRLHNNSSSSGSMPKTSDSSQSPNVTTLEGGTCSRSFYSEALESELLLEGWQKWAQEHNLPVE